MERKLILIVEDDKQLLDMLHNVLKKDYHVRLAEHGDEALLRVEEQTPDLIVLDVMMPKMNGFEVCRHLRKDPQTVDIPILFLTARTDEIDVIQGLEIGGDDYVTKPFSMNILKARIKSMLRRTHALQSEPSTIQVDDLVLDSVKHTAQIHNHEVALTRIEHDLLRCLMENSRTTLSASDLQERVWGYNDKSDLRAVRTHIGNLRKKLKVIDRDYQYIHTIHGDGYQLVKL